MGKVTVIFIYCKYDNNNNNNNNDNNYDNNDNNISNNDYRTMKKKIISNLPAIKQNKKVKIRNEIVSRIPEWNRQLW